MVNYYTNPLATPLAAAAATTAAAAAPAAGDDDMMYTSVEHLVVALTNRGDYRVTNEPAVIIAGSLC